MANEEQSSSDDFWDTSNSTELSDGHSYDLIYGDALWWEDNWPAKKWNSITRKTPAVGPAEVLTAVVIWHQRPDNGETCGVLIHFTKPLQDSEIQLDYPIWTVRSFEPLTIMPSIVCRVCGDHGFVKDGSWFSI